MSMPASRALGEHRQRKKLPMTVTLIAKRIAEQANVVGTAQANMRERAHLIYDLIEPGGIVVEDREQSKGDEGQRAFVRGAEHAFTIGVAGGHEDIAEIGLHRSRVGRRPARPGAAQDIRAAHKPVGVVAEIEHRFTAGERRLRIRPCEQDIVRLLRVGGVACEIPHAREIPDRDHVVAPFGEIHVGTAAHVREWARHVIAKRGFSIRGKRRVAGFPRLLP